MKIIENFVKIIEIDVKVKMNKKNNRNGQKIKISVENLIKNC